MGAPFFDIPGEPAPPDILDNAVDGVVFVVCRFVDRGEHMPREIHLQGVASDRQTAVAMCIDETYFFGPIPVNILLPAGRIEWIGVEYPKRKK